MLACFVLGTAECAQASVIFSGLNDAQENNVRIVMPLASAECTFSRWRIERLFRQADKDLRRALEALGYYTIDVSKSLGFDKECWRAEFDVQVGAPVLLRQVEIDITGDAAGDEGFRSLIKASQPVAGDILDHGKYTEYKSLLMRTALSHGYFDAAFDKNDVVVDLESNTANVTLALRSGTRYRFGEVSFSSGILREDLLSGYSDIRRGAPYRAESINELYEVLNGSTYFSSVSIRTDPLNRVDKTVPVDVVLQPGTRKLYSVGAGFTTDTGPHLRLGYANLRRNENGSQFEAKLFESTVKSEISAAYRWPKRDPRTEWFSVSMGAQQEDTETSENETYKVGIQRSRSLSAAWLETRYLDYALENFRVGDQDTSSRLVIVGVNWEAAAGRELRRVNNGWRLSFDLRGAIDSFGSDTSFAQLRITAKWIHSLSDNMRLLARGGFGTTAKDALLELPVSVRLFSGGDRSVRGYDFETLGPTDASGMVIGGSNLAEGSLELDFLFKRQWAVAAFVDSGSAFNGTAVDFSTGVGVGLRWYSPVGPIRLDLAHPLDDPGQKLRVHISLGLDL